MHELLICGQCSVACSSWSDKLSPRENTAGEQQIKFLTGLQYKKSVNQIYSQAEINMVINP